jgi:hypothetical protein
VLVLLAGAAGCWCCWLLAQAGRSSPSRIVADPLLRRRVWDWSLPRPLWAAAVIPGRRCWYTCWPWAVRPAVRRGGRSSCSAHHDTHRPIASSCRHAARDDSDHGRRNGRRCWHRWFFCTVVAGVEGVAVCVCVGRRAAVTVIGRWTSTSWWSVVAMSWWCQLRHHLRRCGVPTVQDRQRHTVHRTAPYRAFGCRYGCGTIRVGLYGCAARDVTAGPPRHLQLPTWTDRRLQAS